MLSHEEREGLKALIDQRKRENLDTTRRVEDQLDKMVPITVKEPWLLDGVPIPPEIRHVIRTQKLERAKPPVSESQIETDEERVERLQRQVDAEAKAGGKPVLHCDQPDCNFTTRHAPALGSHKSRIHGIAGANAHVAKKDKTQTEKKKEIAKGGKRVSRTSVKKTSMKKREKAESKEQTIEDALGEISNDDYADQMAQCVSMLKGQQALRSRTLESHRKLMAKMMDEDAILEKADHNIEQLKARMGELLKEL